MKHIESCTMKVYETTNYNIFKDLVGNRARIQSNIKNITSSITKYGWLGAPVIVNEKMEIIDGQNRTKAAENANIPVPYMIFPGYGINECIALNKNSRNWITTDYIMSWKNQGNQQYIRLVETWEHYGDFSMDDVSSLAYSKGIAIVASSKSRDHLRDGLLCLTDDEWDAVCEKLEYLTDFAEFYKKIKGAKGRSFIFYNAILYFHGIDIVDEDKFMNKVFVNNWDKITPSTSPEDYLKQFDALYNDRINKDLSKRTCAYEMFLLDRKKTTYK